MKKSILPLIVLLGFSLLSYGQSHGDISHYYEDFISIQKVAHNGREYLVKRVVESNKTNSLTNLVNTNTMFADYLLANFSSNTNNPDLLKISDSLALTQAYFAGLKTDTLFNSVMAGWVAKTVGEELPKDTITVDQMLNIAVKYFNIYKLTDEGYYVGKVCGGLNGLKQTEPKCEPYLEAFCFSSILKHYQGEEFNINAEFAKAIKALYQVNLGVDPSEKLLRAQGAMFMLMRNNENLMAMLRSEYVKQKSYLPFVLRERVGGKL